MAGQQGSEGPQGFEDYRYEIKVEGAGTVLIRPVSFMRDYVTVRSLAAFLVPDDGSIDPFILCLIDGPERLSAPVPTEAQRQDPWDPRGSVNAIRAYTGVTLAIERGAVVARRPKSLESPFTPRPLHIAESQTEINAYFTQMHGPELEDYFAQIAALSPEMLRAIFDQEQTHPSLLDDMLDAFNRNNEALRVGAPLGTREEQLARLLPQFAYLNKIAALAALRARVNTIVDSMPKPDDPGVLQFAGNKKLHLITRKGQLPTCGYIEMDMVLTRSDVLSELNDLRHIVDYDNNFIQCIGQESATDLQKKQSDAVKPPDGKSPIEALMSFRREVNEALREAIKGFMGPEYRANDALVLKYLEEGKVEPGVTHLTTIFKSIQTILDNIEIARIQAMVYAGSHEKLLLNAETCDRLRNIIDQNLPYTDMHTLVFMPPQHQP